VVHGPAHGPAYLPARSMSSASSTAPWTPRRFARWPAGNSLRLARRAGLNSGVVLPARKWEFIVLRANVRCPFFLSLAER
jgi:hypothetical protein